MPNEYSNFTEPDVGKPNDGRQGATSDPHGSTNPGMHWDPNAFNPQTQRNGAWVPDNQQTAGNAGSGGGFSNTFSPGSWGGSGNVVDGQGNDIQGTNGAALDVDRYRQMGQTPQYGTGPKINTTQSGESRGISQDAIGLLGQTAAGTSPSVAEQLGTKQANDAAAAEFSMGASVRGGATNRAAAARHAVMQGAQIQQQGAQSNAATRAGEMAAGRSAYLGATTGQRGQDIGLATSQAGLDVGQRSANDAHEQFYEGLGQQTQQAQVSHQLGRTNSDDAAASAAFNTSMQRDAAAQARQDKNINTAIAGAQGVVSAYNKVNQDSPPKPNPDDPNFDSDERMKQGVTPLGEFDTELAAEDVPRYEAWKAKVAPKDSGADYDYRGAFRAGEGPDAHGHWTDRFKKPNHPTFSVESQYAPAGNPGRWDGDRFIKPMSDKDAAKLKSQGESMLASQRAGLDAGPSVGGEKTGTPAQRVRAKARQYDNPYDDYDHSMFGRSGEEGLGHDTAALHAGIEKRIGEDALPSKMDPTNPYAHESLFGHAPEGYAKSRAHQAGNLFGPKRIDASYKERLWGPGEKDAQTGSAPGTDDFDSSAGPVKDKFSRQIMTSDVHAKREAFQDGVDAAKLDAGVPSYMFEKPRGDSPGGHAASSSVARKDSRPQRQEVQRREDQRAAGAGFMAEGAATMPLFPPVAMGKMLGGAHAAYTATEPGALPKAPPTQAALPVPPPPPPPPETLEDYWRKHPLAAPVKRDATGKELDEVTTSDKRAKKSHGESPMAAANRSMDASLYEYKPEFAAKNGQRVGETNVGPMAQNMAANSLAKTAIVKDDRTGLLGIDKAKGLKLVMGGLADVQRQVDQLKRKKKAT